MTELDPWLSRAQRQDATLVRLEALLMATTEAALAETLAEMWVHVLGERVVLVAATEPPNLGGLDQRARSAWRAALERWVKPIVLWGYRQQYPDAPQATAERWWTDTANRLDETANSIVKAVTETVRVFKGEPVDQLRDRLARMLQLDANTLGRQEEIASVEVDLLNAQLSTVDRAALWSRRVRMLAATLRIDASRAWSSGTTALESIDVASPRSAEPLAGLSDIEREIQQIDFRLYRNPEAPVQQQVTLTSRRRQLMENGSETWRETSRRMSRSQATGLLNASLWQRYTDESQRDGTELVHRWVATLTDNRTRPSHRAADGQVVPLGEPFILGTVPMQFPGDPDGPLDEWVNCRCSQLIMTRAEHDEIASTLTADGGPVTQPSIEQTLGDLPPVMWHGTVAREDVFTGDRRKFTGGAIRAQAFPMPIRFQREDWGGHTGAVVTANMEEARRFDGRIRAWGTFADSGTTPEVAEVISLMANRMMRGISIDGDDVLDSQFSVEMDAEGNVFEVYDSMRLRSATFVAIPAFDEAEVFLGPPPMEWLLEGEPVRVEQNDPGPTAPIDLDALLAAVSTMPENLQDYWVHGEGAGKIRWGTPGDFSRCVRNLNDYVAPGQAEGTCANLHHAALGKWPGESASSREALVAAAGEAPYILADFYQRELPGPTPLTITDDGDVFGHVAIWGTCHTGFSDACVVAPHSKTDYALFHVGAVRLADGTDYPIGKLTVGGGHANTRYGVRAATAHYDDASTAVAVVRAWEDDYGIQVSGRVIPGTDAAKLEELRRSPLSGDWREYAGNLEMIAAHGVNTPGFPVMRTMVAASEGRQLSLVAAGAMYPDQETRIAALEARVAPIIDVEIRVAELAARMSGGN